MRVLRSRERCSHLPWGLSISPVLVTTQSRRTRNAFLNIGRLTKDTWTLLYLTRKIPPYTYLTKDTFTLYTLEPTDPSP